MELKIYILASLEKSSKQIYFIKKTTTEKSESGESYSY